MTTFKEGETVIMYLPDELEEKVVIIQRHSRIEQLHFISEAYDVLRDNGEIIERVIPYMLMRLQ